MTKPTTWTPSAQAALGRLKGKLFASTTEAAEVLCYDRRTIRKGIESGEIRATRVGATFRIPVAWILAQAGLVQCEWCQHPTSEAVTTSHGTRCADQDACTARTLREDAASRAAGGGDAAA